MLGLIEVIRNLYIQIRAKTVKEPILCGSL